MLRALLKLLVQPPLCLFLVIGAGLVVRGRRPRLGRALAASGALALVLLTLPLVSSALLISLQSHPPLDPDAIEGLARGAGAVVVLGGDLRPGAGEYGAPCVGPLTLERCRYGAWLGRRARLPLLAAGGSLREGAPKVADAMAALLDAELGAEVRWVEAASRTTRENAHLAADLLLAAGIERALVVTHAWHMPRALAAFAETGLEVVPAPTAFASWPRARPSALLPSARALQESSWAIHEWVGRLWYALTA